MSIWPFYGKRVLTDVEQVLYWRLVQALPDNVVLAQVQLSRFLGVKKGNKHIQWLNRVSQKSADFVVCNRDFSVVAVIELDDSSHSRASRKKADADKTKAIADAGLRLIRWNVKKMPTAVEIQQAIHPAQQADPSFVGLGADHRLSPDMSAIRPDRSAVLANLQDLQSRI